MIPQKLLNFLENHGNAGVAGLRDQHLKPFGSRVCGWSFSDEGRRMTALLPATSQDQVLDALRQNGQIAISIEEFPLHETYQLKGRYLSHRPLTAEDEKRVKDTRERFANGVRHLVPDEKPIDNLRASIPDASFAVEFEVREIFVQTPGPGAGARIYPPEP